MRDKKICVDDGDFEDEVSAVAYAKAMARELVWHPDMEPGYRLCVVDECGDTILEISLAKPPN